MTQTATLSRLRAFCPVLSVVVSVAVYAIYQLLALSMTGSFEFPLDDVYIHMAVAEQIAAGGYGVNPGEFTSAASSPIYPFLLLPFAGAPAQIWLPLFWNVAAMVAAAWLWARIVVTAVSDTRWAVGLTLLGLFAFNFYGAAFVAMEHMLHILASLAVLRGLQIRFDEDRVSWLLVAGMVLGPMIRFEGLAVTGGAALALGMTGRWALGLGLFAAALVPVGLFMGFLVSLGLKPLPNSVMAKLAGTNGNERFALLELPIKVLVQLQNNPAIVLLIAIIMAVLLLARRMAGTAETRGLLLAAIFAGSGHMLLGQFGWFERYELYMLTFVFGLLLIAFFREDTLRSGRMILVAGMGFLAFNYASYALKLGVYGPLGIQAQHQNMARFVKDHYKGDVAVNDLGHVSWGNPNQVLDLWGLASYRALTTRLDNPYPGWAADMVKDAGIGLVIIYDKWLKDGGSADWVKIGELKYTGYAGFLGDRTVSYYATSPETAPALREAFAAYIPHAVGAVELQVVTDTE